MYMYVDIGCEARLGLSGCDALLLLPSAHSPVPSDSTCIVEPLSSHHIEPVCPKLAYVACDAIFTCLSELQQSYANATSLFKAVHSNVFA